MNDFRDLKAIAEACQQHQPLRFMRSHGALYIRNDNGIVFDVHQNRSFPEFMAQNKDYADLVLAANPAAVLELIASGTRMAARLMHCPSCQGQGDVYSGRASYEGYNQPPEPIMDKCGECDGDGVLGDTGDCMSILDEVETLRAELAGLKTGYEAYERVNAELRAECEALRKDAERYRWIRVKQTFIWLVQDWFPKENVLTDVDAEIDAAMSKESGDE